MTEFELIRRYFAAQPVRRRDVVLGIGDDAALLTVPHDRELVVTTDILVSDIHFLPDVDPEALGHKALAVNLSDLAAMGAEPAWFTLNLVLPRVDEGWLTRFCAGLYALARRHEVQLVGGDTARGPLAVSVTAHGFVPHGRALRRAAARPGDRIFVTGVLGDAGLALAHRLGQRRLPEDDFRSLRERLERPLPRIAEGLVLRGLAAAAIDVSDGLAADLGHVLEESGVGADVDVERLPVSPVYRKHLEAAGWDAAIAGGDDYELCFTVSPGRLGEFEGARSRLSAGATEIGVITAEPGLRLRRADGTPYRPGGAGYDHFAGVEPP
jgi:thiamine-monophosphate kinase